MIEAIIAMIGGKAVVAGGGIIAILIGFIAMFKAAFSAGKNSELAKDAKSNEKALNDLARANAARANANAGKLSDDDGFKRD